MITMIQAINVSDIPSYLRGLIAIQDDNFPLYGSNGIVQVEDDGNQFSEWLKKQGYKFPDTWGWLAVRGM